MHNYSIFVGKLYSCEIKPTKIYTSKNQLYMEHSTQYHRHVKSPATLPYDGAFQSLYCKFCNLSLQKPTLFLVKCSTISYFNGI